MSLIKVGKNEDGDQEFIGVQKDWDALDKADYDYQVQKDDEAEAFFIKKEMEDNE